MDIVGAARRDGRQRSEIARQRIGPNGFALDDAGVAVAGLATRRLAIDQHDRPAAALQMQRSGDPDHPGAENDNTSHCCDHLWMRFSRSLRAATPDRGWKVSANSAQQD
jgi:hypothetical protein